MLALSISLFAALATMTISAMHVGIVAAVCVSLWAMGPKCCGIGRNAFPFDSAPFPGASITYALTVFPGVIMMTSRTCRFLPIGFDHGRPSSQIVNGLRYWFKMAWIHASTVRASRIGIGTLSVIVACVIQVEPKRNFSNVKFIHDSMGEPILSVPIYPPVTLLTQGRNPFPAAIGKHLKFFSYPFEDWALFWHVPLYDNA